MRNLSLHKLAPLLFMMVIATTSSAPSTESEQVPPSNTNRPTSLDQGGQSPNFTEAQEIKQQITRIEEKLKAEPKVEGWVLVGDANMHLQHYREAVTAYQNAYLLSDYDEKIRAKLKRALHQAGMEDSSD